MNTSYIVSGYRSAVTKADKGSFSEMRSDDLAVAVIKHMVKNTPGLKKEDVDDVIVGCAVPEAEQGLQMARWIALMALGKEVPGVIVNRYCASGLETIAMASAKISMGMADVIIAGGTESMSQVPTRGWKTSPNHNITKSHSEYLLNMGVTGEEVAKEFNISRTEQDKFGLQSHQNAIKAIKNGYFKDQIAPVEVERIFVDNEEEKREKKIIEVDEGPMENTNLEKMSKLPPAFKKNGVVTAGNSSQRSDGAAFVVMMSERKMKELGLEPEAKLIGCSVVGVNPRIMGIGPKEAVPKVLKQTGLKLADIDLVELNEAFAAQSLAVINELEMNPEIVNVNGGAIALGHPLGCSGAKLSIQIIHELKRRNKRFGLVTACVGGGQGIAGIIERLN
ncbi:thiolase family protein [Psychroflexus salinarum]|uniref:acetyl-CoA C-acyltransferase n=1 Tax=Psychroflexus salinarum TaxID=546024 RepID=A0ABW3GPB7_9FLAO